MKCTNFNEVSERRSEIQKQDHHDRHLLRRNIEAMSDLTSNQAVSLQAMSQSVASMQENIASLGKNIARAQCEQTALLDQLRLLGQSSEQAVVDPSEPYPSPLISVVEVNELDEQNRHIQFTLEQMRQAIRTQNKQLSGLTAAMTSVESRAEQR
jgi:hypothetical protein